MNRLVDFKVDHPDLYAPPVGRRRGKRSFEVNKNKNSVDFRLSALTPISLKIRPTENFTVKDPCTALKEILIAKDKELETLKKVSQNFSQLNENRRKYMSPEPRSVLIEQHLPSPNKNSSYSLIHQEYYSKSRPKVIQNNPIIGYPTRTLNLTPDKRLANIGSLVFNSSYK